MTTYPTPWSYGLPRGAIRDRNTIIRLEIDSGGQKDNQSYKVIDYGSHEECMKQVLKDRLKKSHDLGLTRNEIRFLGEKIIEVQLTQGKTFITDGENLELVNKYPLQARAKKEKGKIRYYVMYQDKKKVNKFSDLLNKKFINKQVQYVNGNTLDLRKANMKISGLDFHTANKAEELSDAYAMEDYSKYYGMLIDQFPKNKWILGYVKGTIFEREENKGKIVTMVIIDTDGKDKTKTFNIKDYGTIKKARIEALKYMINICHKFELVKNKIRINDKYLEVTIDEENIMKTNLIFLPLFIPTLTELMPEVTISKKVDGVRGNNGKIYAYTYVKNDNNKQTTFHQLIMGSSFIDHINGDPLDNRLENLRFTNPSHNNTNRISSSDTGITGVNHGKDKAGEFYRARIRDNGEQFCKYFYVNKYCNQAKQLAEKYRKNVMEICFDTEDLDPAIYFTNSNDLDIINNAIKRTELYYQDVIKRMIVNPNKYLQKININEKIRKKMHQYYSKIQYDRFIQLNMRLEKLKEWRGQISSKKKLNNKKIVEV